MTNKRLFKLLFTSSLAAVSLCSCGSAVTVKDTVTIAKNKYSEILGDSFKIDATYTSSHKDVFLTYSSSDNSILKIDNDGYVSSFKKGSAVVTVSSGYATASCTVEIGYGEFTPVIKLDSLSSDYLDLTIGDDFSFHGYVLFNGKNYENPFSYSIEDETIASFSGNKLTALKAGETNITISSSFGGEELHPLNICLTVKEAVTISLINRKTNKQLNSVHLFSLSEFEGEAYENEISLDVNVTENGSIVQKDKYTVSILSGNDVVTYLPETNLLKGEKIGKAVMLISYSTHGETFEKTFDIVVSAVIGQYKGPLFELDLNNGSFPSDDIFASFSDKEIRYATSLDLATDYKIHNGNVFGIGLNKTLEQSIIVYNDMVGYVVSFRAYSKIIKTFDDLSYLRLTSLNQINDGYVVLANNIDCLDRDLPHHYYLDSQGRESSFITTGYASMAQYGFRGIFDGRGYTIKNINLSSGGLFGIIGQGASISNLGLDINSLKASASVSNAQGLATYINNATLSNLFINVRGSSNGIGFAASLCYVLHNKNAISNCLVYADLNNPAFSSTYSGYGACSARLADVDSLPSSSSEFLKECYFVSSLPLSHFTDSKDATKKYKYDVEGWSDDLSGIIPNAKHYASESKMKEAKNAFSSFSDSYWTVSGDMLYWKNA